MPFSSLVMSFSKFVSPGLPVQGPSEAQLQPVHSDQADPIGTVTQGDSAGGGEKQAEKATPHRSTYSEPEKKNPHISSLCWKSLWWGWGVSWRTCPPGTWGGGMGQAASGPRPHPDPICSMSEGEAGEQRSRLLQTALGGSSASPSDIPCFPSHVVCICLFFMWRRCFQSHQRGRAQQPCSHCQHAAPTCNSAASDKVGNPEGARMALAGLFFSCMQTVSINSRRRCQGRGSRREVS